MTEEKKEWLSVSEVARILDCTIQNVHYLIKGRIRPNAKRKKMSFPKFQKVKTTKIGHNLISYSIHITEIENYLQKGEKS